MSRQYEAPRKKIEQVDTNISAHELAVSKIRDWVTLQDYSLDEIANPSDKMIEDFRDQAEKIYTKVNSDIMRDGSGQLISLPLSLFLEKAESEIYGLGEIENLINDPTVEDIALNDHDEIFVKRSGKDWEFTGIKYSDPIKLLDLLNKRMAESGVQCTTVTPMADGVFPKTKRNPDGARVNLLTSPITDTKVNATIRVPRVRQITFKQYLDNNMLSKEAANYIINAVHSGLNIAVIGATGTGKTTFLKTLCELHDPIAFRQVIVEDTRELSIFPNHPNPNVVYLNTRLGNNDGLTEINQSECVANSLRMRPDSISLGEARKGEVFDFLSAMSTGHGYGKLSFHADGPKFVNQRLTFMASMNPACSFVPLSQVAQMVALSINIIVYIEIEHGKRHIESITEHTGIVNYPQPNVFSPEQNTVFQWNHETDEMDFINDTVFKKQFARKGISADTLYQGRI